MTVQRFIPRASAFDPAAKSEGSIDPLGLVPIADRLSVRLVPGMRERMKHPRYLTLLSVGASICRDFSADQLAADGISPPIQVYEWYIVQALVSELLGKGLVGLPGSEKASAAMKKGLPLNASRYLRVPSVFGFYGVYKTLARDMRLIQGDRLDEAAEELLYAYEDDQDLRGLHSGRKGNGQAFGDQLKRAVEDGLKAGCVDRRWQWSFNAAIASRMHPAQAGPKEAELLFQLIRNDRNQMRQEVMDVLLAYVREYDRKSGIQERHFHAFMLDKVRSEVKKVVEAVMAYERFSRLLTNAFEAVLFRVSGLSFRCSMQELAELPEITLAVDQLPALFQACSEQLEFVGEQSEFRGTFSRFTERMNPNDFTVQLLEHHEFIQRRKPPLGKATWIERLPGDKVLLRPLYVRRESLVNNDLHAYVYAYRANSLSSFMVDLKKI